MNRWLAGLLCFLAFQVEAQVQRPPQFVLMSFDGSKSVNFWQESRAFAQANNVTFTYFISGVYFLPTAQRRNYVEPQRGAGQSAIGFGGDASEIPARLEQVKLAMQEGHEIASHGNAHFDGGRYTAQQWLSEFHQFSLLMANAWPQFGNKATMPAWWQSYFLNSPSKEVNAALNHVTGFRAPQLGVGAGLWQTLSDYNFTYDASRVDKASYWPQKINGVWNFPLAGLRIHGSNKNTLSMDYNFYVAQSGGVAGPANRHAEYEEQMYQTYINYFNNNYQGNRAPIHIGHHFSKWNGGAYWRALQRFAKSVCGQPEVRCVTYKELMMYMENSQQQGLKLGYAAKIKHPLTEAELAMMRFASPISAGDLNEWELDAVRAQSHDHFNHHGDEK